MLFLRRLTVNRAQHLDSALGYTIPLHNTHQAAVTNATKSLQLYRGWSENENFFDTIYAHHRRVQEQTYLMSCTRTRNETPESFEIS